MRSTNTWNRHAQQFFRELVPLVIVLMFGFVWLGANSSVNF